MSIRSLAELRTLIASQKNQKGKPGNAGPNIPCSRCGLFVAYGAAVQSTLEAGQGVGYTHAEPCDPEAVAAWRAIRDRTDQRTSHLQEREWANS